MIILKVKPPNYISMESRNCTEELLRQLYIDENKTQTEIRNIFNIGEKVLNRWFKESGIEKKKERGRYSFNKNFFDTINTEDKAYWLGFIWCDGYICRSNRKGYDTYDFKLDLAIQDKKHIEKFKNSLNSEHPIKIYKSKSYFNKEKDTVVARIYIANRYFAKTLYDKYILIPDRHDTEKLIKNIPESLIRHFIRGVLEADGSISDYYAQEKRLKIKTRKMAIRFYTYENLLIFIREHFIEKGLSKSHQQFRKRHEDRDGYACELSYTGNKQVRKILNYLYEDATVFLDRKKEICNSILNDKEIN